MKQRHTALLALIFTLAACAPRVSQPVAPPAEIIYTATAAQIHPVVVRAISTSPGLPDSNGWIITDNDIAGGFVTAQTVTERLNLRNIYRPFLDTESLSVVISPNETGDSTAVITQFTRGASPVVLRIHEQLEATFGEPTQSGILSPSD